MANVRPDRTSPWGVRCASGLAVREELWKRAKVLWLPTLLLGFLSLSRLLPARWPASRASMGHNPLSIPSKSAVLIGAGPKRPSSPSADSILSGRWPGPALVAGPEGCRFCKNTARNDRPSWRFAERHFKTLQGPGARGRVGGGGKTIVRALSDELVQPTPRSFLRAMPAARRGGGGAAGTELCLGAGQNPSPSPVSGAGRTV